MKGESKTQNEFDNKNSSDIITKDELYKHFDLNGDGKVTKQNYDDHIYWHCTHTNSKDCNCKSFNPFYKSS